MAVVGRAVLRRHRLARHAFLVRLGSGQLRLRDRVVAGVAVYLWVASVVGLAVLWRVAPIDWLIDATEVIERTGHIGGPDRRTIVGDAVEGIERVVAADQV